MNKKIWKISLLFIAAFLCCTAVSCSDDDDDNDNSNFNYPLEYIYGTWDLSEILLNGVWHDVTKWPYTQFAASATFNSNGTYSATGYFGDGTGTWSAKGNTLTTYVDGKVYITYEISSATNTDMEGQMTEPNGILNFRAKKQ